MFGGSPVVMLDGQRQVVVVEPSGHRRALTRDPAVLWAFWGQNEVEDVHSWPAWSPDQQKIAAFRVSRGRPTRSAADEHGGADQPSVRVVVLDASGIAAVEGALIRGRMPIYLQWARDGRGLAVLCQQDDDLVLDRMDPRRPERSHEVLRGSPLFFSWIDEGQIAAFVGEKAGRALVVLSEGGGRLELPGLPGNFCSPVQVGHDLVYVAHHRGHVGVLSSRPQGTGTRELEIVDGLVALVASGDGRTLARAVAPDGDGSPYRDLRIVDPVSGRTSRVSDADCVAFFFAGDDLVVARRHVYRNSIAWMRVSRDGRDEALLAEVQPSRDLRFWLRFFEQYCPSHPIVDPSGKTLLLAGDLIGAGASESRESRVWAVPLDGSPPEDLGPGPFAAFPPAFS